MMMTCHKMIDILNEINSFIIAWNSIELSFWILKFKVNKVKWTEMDKCYSQRNLDKCNKLIYILRIGVGIVIGATWGNINITVSQIMGRVWEII